MSSDWWISRILSCDWTLDSHMRMLDLGQEAVVLSGLSKHAASSLKNIKNLYDETKYLKSYLEKVNRYSDSNI